MRRGHNPRQRPAYNRRSLTVTDSNYTELKKRIQSLGYSSIAIDGNIGVGKTSLARLMVARVSLIDPGRLKAESLLTHPALPGDVGQNKATNLARAVRAISPATEVLAFEGPIQDFDLANLADADFVLLASDNLNAEVAAGQKALWLDLPLIQASVDGATLVSHVRFLKNDRAEGPCPACAFGQAEWLALNRGTQFSCEFAGAPRARLLCSSLHHRAAS